MKNLLIPSLLLCIACNQTPSVDLGAELESLRQADAEYKSYVTALDLDNWVTFYDPEAIVYPPNSSPITGLENIRAMGDELSALEGFDAVFELNKIEISSDGTMGYTSSHITLSGTIPGGETMTESGPDFHVWKKQEDGSWKIVIDIWNSDQPLPEPVMEEADSVASE